MMKIDYKTTLVKIEIQYDDAALDASCMLKQRELAKIYHDL